MSVLVVAVQARTGSTRLPGKVLAEVDGRPMLRFELDRLATLPCDHLVVATTDLPADDAIVDIAHGAGAGVVRGPEADVLARYRLVIDTYAPSTIVRLTGDCPLIDPQVVADVIALHQAEGADYTSNVHPRSFPHGLDVEVTSAAALGAAAAEATDPYEREHVTPFLYRHPERFRMANLASGEELADVRWTVDTAADLARVRRLVALVADPVTAPWRDLLAAERAADPFSPRDRR